MNYTEVCDYIEGIVRFTTKHSNQHTRACLELLGNPDDSFRTIHIAGTNGKGSTCAFLAAVLNKSGCRTGLFVSPHLIRLNERIQIAGEEISEQAFVRVFEQVYRAAKKMEEAGEGHPSYFEFLFLMAMVYFREQHVEAAVIETGLGGRLDATNALNHPVMTVITSIGMDHMQYLGETLPEIAREKAGIIKAGVPCVYAADDAETAKVIEEEAKQKGAPCYPLTAEQYEVLQMDDGKIDFLTSFRYDGLHRYHTNTRGTYQAENGALSVYALKILKETDESFRSRLSDDVIEAGISDMYWPGRMEEVKPHVYLDGAHNDSGIRRFIESVNGITKGKPAGLVFAVVNDKDYTDMIHDLAVRQDWEFVIVSEAGGDRKTDAGEIAELFRRNHVRHVEVVRDPQEAFMKAYLMKHGLEDLFVCGSLYLIGQIEELLHK